MSGPNGCERWDWDNVPGTEALEVQETCPALFEADRPLLLALLRVTTLWWDDPRGCSGIPRTNSDIPLTFHTYPNNTSGIPWAGKTTTHINQPPTPTPHLNRHTQNRLKETETGAVGIGKSLTTEMLKGQEISPQGAYQLRPIWSKCSLIMNVHYEFTPHTQEQQHLLPCIAPL